jgi:hypothetical protein
MYKQHKDISMKFRNIYLIVTAAVIITAAGSCKKELANANIDPDTQNSTQYNPNLLLTTVQLAYTGAPTEGGSVWVTKWGGVAGFIQHVASTNTGFYYGDKYLNNIGAMGQTFQDNYTSAVQPAVELYQLTLNKPQYRNLHQMSRIMKAMIFEQLTDLYGDIPYFQAGLGYFNRIYSPVYDKQQVIYTDLLKEVSQATDSLTENGDNPTGDILYSYAGDQIAEWKEFGNSLLLRMAMRLTKVAPTTAQQYVTQLVGQTMQSNADNAIIQHVLSANALTSNQDAAQIFSQDSVDVRLSSTIVSNMKKNNDPRLPVVAWIAYGLDNNGNFPGFADNTAADQIGLPPGYILGGLNPAINLLIVAKDSLPAEGLAGYSRISDNLLSISAPSLILTYAETELLLAEAAQRWPTIPGIGTAAAHYNNGVLAAISQLSAYGAKATISDAAAQTYLNSQAYVPGMVTGLSQINMQYWLCTLMDEYESWSNWRRTSTLANTLPSGASGYPSLTPTNYPGNVSQGTIPRRLVYPPSQKVTNLANYNKAVAGMTGGDKITTRVWWDTN